MQAEIQIAIAENLNPRCAPSRAAFKQNRPTLTATYSAIGDQRGITRGRVHETRGEDRVAAACAVNRAAIASKCPIGGRASEEPRAASQFATDSSTVVNKNAVTRGG